MLGHRWRAVALAVADTDALLAGRAQIDIVGAGGSHQDQSQIGAGRQGFGAQGDLVADDHLGALQALDHLLRGGVGMQLQGAEAVVQRTQVQVAQVQRAVIEEDGAAIVDHELYLLHGGSKA